VGCLDGLPGLHEILAMLAGYSSKPELSIKIRIMSLEYGVLLPLFNYEVASDLNSPDF
jgi:hypothetical protein